MDKEQLIKRLKEIQENYDQEQAHIDADDALIEFINDEEISVEYKKIDKWYA